MEKILLSLKSIYMTLVNDDFPIYSESVIGRVERKGYTLFRFWHRYMSDDFRCQSCGKMIWRSDRKRNRYLSYLCNRSLESKYYEEYSQELLSCIHSTSLRRQIRIFQQFLSTTRYKHDVLLRRINELTRLAESDDSSLTPEITNHIRSAAAWHADDPQGELFQAGYLLTMLTLYAAAGDAMSQMDVLRMESFSLDSMWRLSDHISEDSRGVSYLTVFSGLLQNNALPRHRFFGREEELFDLREMVASGQKCLIWGIGGIGKTELLRQLLQICEDEQLVSKIAIVPYEGSLIESFSRCFPEFQAQDSEGSFRSILYRMTEESRYRKVLLVIDNLSSSLQEDPAIAELATLPFGIIVTTRHTELDGFTTYPLANPSVSTGALIFRDNYGHPIHVESRKALHEMLEDPAICHPLTLRLMAKAARSKGWSVQELKNQLEAGAKLTWQEGHRTLRLNQIYHQLYSYLEIPEDSRRIAELFTLLPRDSYAPETLKNWFPDTFSQENARNHLRILAEGGWLDQDGTGFSMHPLIAQCLRRTVLTQERVDGDFGHICQYLLQCRMASHGAPDDKLTRVSEIMMHVSAFLSGYVSKNWLDALTIALSNLDATPRVHDEGLKLLDAMEKRCPTMDALTRLRCLILRCNWLSGSQEQCREIWQQQSENPTLPRELLLDFYRIAGNAATYQYTDYSLAEALLKAFMAQETEPILRVDGYGNLVDCLAYERKMEEALIYCLEGLDYVAQHPQCCEYIVCSLLSRQCQLHCLMQRIDLAAEVVPEMELRMAQTEDPKSKYHLAIGLGYYAGRTGEHEKALKYEQIKLTVLEQLRGRDNLDYHIGEASVAFVLSNLERYDEAIPQYRKALEYMRKNSHGFWIQNVCNSFAVLYLKQKEPKTALEYLSKALECARPIGGSALADVQRNRAVAYAQLGEDEEERLCLEEAVPLLEEAYGAENSLASTARHRLTELQEKKDAE